MFKHILLVQLFLASLFAHGGFYEHIHFFSFLHSDGFVLFLISVIAGFGIFKYIKKETN